MVREPREEKNVPLPQRFVSRLLSPVSRPPDNIAPMISGFPLGTDGWRGVIADGCTFESVRRGGAAAAGVFARAGMPVLLGDRPTPPPAVSYHVRRLGLAGGLAITASHNPAHYNGGKIKTHRGSSAPPELYEAVARAAGAADASAPGSSPPGEIRVADLLSPYRADLASRVRLDAIRSAGIFVLADAMHGAAGTLLEDILSGGSTRVVSFRWERDAFFGGADTERLGVLDSRGGFVSPHRVLALLLLHAFRRRGLSGGIARTFSTSLLIDHVAAGLGAALYETPIGFKYVAELMNRGDAVAGGEESGGYAFAFHLPERDGVFNALLLIESLALGGQSLDRALEDLAAEFGSFAYGRRDVYLPAALIGEFLAEINERPPAEVAGDRVSDVRDLDGVKYILGDRGWLLHRLSGTEPMIRLYCEHEEESAVEKILDQAESRLRDFAEKRGVHPDGQN